jgi:hypothetical protein
MKIEGQLLTASSGEKVLSDAHTGGLGFSGHNDAEETADRYPAGKKVDVYYDPGNPADSILEPGTTYLDQQWFWFICVLFIVMGSLFMLTFIMGRLVSLLRRS